MFAFNPGMVLTDLLTDVVVIAGCEQRLNVFPTVVRMLARPVDAPANKAVWIASSATDGKTGLEISLSSPAKMLGQVLREGLRTVRKRSTPVSMKIRTIPPYRD